jgi:hypothetical protein
MKAYLPYKEKVIALRKEGKTYREIIDILPIKLKKSTISDWCQDVPMPAWYEEKIKLLNKTSLKKVHRVSLAIQQQKQENLLAELKLNNAFFSSYKYDKDLLKLMLSALYLGEGAKKKSHRGLLLGSSDPGIVILYIKLLFACYDINIERLRCRICFRADQDINVLQEYWSKITGIPLENFYKTKADPRTVGKPTVKPGYKGVCVITCGGTHIQDELDIIAKTVLESLYAGPIA